MSGAAMAQMTVDATFAAFGKPAQYRPPPGTPGVALDITVILNSADADISGIGDTRAFSPGRTIEIRKSEIAQPLRKARITIIETGETLEITSDPKCQDPDRLVYTATVA